MTESTFQYTIIPTTSTILQLAWTHAPPNGERHQSRYIFCVRLLRTPNQFTHLFMMAYQTHSTQSNITNTTKATQMWICWRKRKIAWDYEVQIDVVSHRHHTCGEHQRAQFWCSWTNNNNLAILICVAPVKLRPRFECSARLTKTNFHFLYTYLGHPFPVLFTLTSGMLNSHHEIYCSTFNTLLQSANLLLITRNCTQCTS